MATTLTNPGFETGDLTGWTVTDAPLPYELIGVTGVTSDPADVFGGTYACGISGGESFVGGWIRQTDLKDVYEGQALEGLIYMIGDSSDAPNRFTVRWELDWYDESDVYIETTLGSFYNSRPTWQAVRFDVVAPEFAAKCRPGLYIRKNGFTEANGIALDQAQWNNVDTSVYTLVSPPNGATYAPGQTIPLQIASEGEGPPVESVNYKVDGVIVATSSTSPYDATTTILVDGTYDVTADVNLEGDTVVNLGPNTITIATVGGTEYSGSNAYTYLIASNFSGLSAAMPSTALVTGVELVIDYEMDAIIRSKDLNNPNPVTSTPEVLFDVTNGGVLEAVLLSSDDSTYTIEGSPVLEDVELNREDFSIVEEGISEGKKWTEMDGPASQATIGGETELFGLQPIAAADFINRAVGIRFYPHLTDKPDYADSGDGVFRIHLDKIRLRVYFDAGSAVYYFASPDKTQVIKGTLVSSYVLDGNFRTGDASGVLQLQPTLEIMDGTQTWIGNDWTIHAAYPPTDANQIGLVADIEGEAELGMEYNGLPTQQQVRDNRSRYEFITENFFGDKDLDSIYGVHGLPRAFAYNTEFFYKIYTQEDPEKDKPRHVANHHYHLALGFEEGRVDMSVVGEPYNFNGVDGASSTGIGDRIVGLLPLSGTILGVFCSKSIWGISGTTIDNFATQVISPNMGAIEYTITDMGSPTYANSYGVYTLSQTQQYGDYLGSPMSQDISPWLRPRLLRKYTSDKEVVCAWPVRSKNQYRLAFSDGYVTSMTLNGSTVPTFSFQKYFYQPNEEDPYVSDDLYSYPTIIPAAVSSQLDDSGEERIHIAPYVDAPVVPPPPPEPAIVYPDYMSVFDGGGFTGMSLNAFPRYADLSFECAEFPIESITNVSSAVLTIYPVGNEQETLGDCGTLLEVVGGTPVETIDMLSGANVFSLDSFVIGGAYLYMEATPETNWIATYNTNDFTYQMDISFTGVGPDGPVNLSYRSISSGGA